MNGSTLSVWALIRSDYARRFPPADQQGVVSTARALWRLIIDPSLRATILVRLAIASPRRLRGFFRRRLISRYSIDFPYGTVVIGPGLRLPHPVGIVIGDGARLGANVTLYQHVSLRAEVGDDVTVWPGAVVAGSITVGDGANIGALTFVNHDIPAHTTYHARSPRGLRQS